GQPGRDERVDLVQLRRVNLQRTAGDDRHDALLHRGADLVDRRLVGVVELHRLRRARLAVVARVVGPLRAADVAVALGVRRLADHEDAGRAVGDRRAGVRRGHHVAALRRGLDPLQDRRARDLVGRAALPGQRPAAGLVADVVAVAARDVDRALAGLVLAPAI